MLFPAFKSTCKNNNFLNRESSNILLFPWLIFFVKLAYIHSFLLSFQTGDWFPNVPSDGKLERFYFFLASLMMINTLGFWATSHR